MSNTRITGIGSYLPRRTLATADLPTIDPPPDEGDLERIGVHRRGWAGPDEGIAEMAASAGTLALKRAGLEPDAIDLIVLSNWTQRRYIPEFAPKLQRLLGARNAVAFDVCCACAGFVFGLSIADGYLRHGRFRRALVVASETTSQRARPGSKSTLVFGDGAGALVLEHGVDHGGRLIDWELASDGDHHDIMEITAQGHVKTHVSQRELNALAAQSFANVSRRILARNGLSMNDVAWLVPHSGTAGIQATLIRTLDVDPAKVLSNFARVGNVSSAAIPTALDEFVTRGDIKPGQMVLSPTTGTGWYAAAALYTVA